MTDATVAPDPEPEKMYSPEEVAELFSLQPSTIRQWIKDGKINAIKVMGSRNRIPRSEVLRMGNQNYG